MNRQVEIHMEGCWIPAQISDIREGELFRMYEADGTMVKSSNGTSVWCAAGNAYQHEGLWLVDIE